MRVRRSATCPDVPPSQRKCCRQAQAWREKPLGCTSLGQHETAYHYRAQNTVWTCRKGARGDARGCGKARWAERLVGIALAPGGGGRGGENRQRKTVPHVLLCDEFHLRGNLKH